MIHLLQKKIEEIYRLNRCPEVNQYLLSPKEFKKFSKTSDNPQVIYVDEGNDATLGVYFGKRIFKRIKNKVKIFTLQDFCVMTEEISHFIYLVWSKSNGKKITLLDLEIQAEVDKYLLATSFFSSKNDVFSNIFGRFMLRKNLGKEEQSRYIEATRLGKKLAATWRKRKISNKEKMGWLRHFYRQNPANRIWMIEKGVS